jgi:hypothetical protein
MSSEPVDDNVNIIALAACKDTTLVPTYETIYDKDFPEANRVDALNDIFNAQNDYIKTIQTKIEQKTRIKFMKFIQSLRNQLQTATDYERAKSSVIEQIKNNQKEFRTLGKPKKQKLKSESNIFFNKQIKALEASREDNRYNLEAKGDEDFEILQADYNVEYTPLRAHLKRLIKTISKVYLKNADVDTQDKLRERRKELCEIKMVDNTNVLKDKRYCGFSWDIPEFTRSKDKGKTNEVDENGKIIDADEFDEYTLNQTMLDKIILQQQTIVSGFTDMFKRIIAILLKIPTDKTKDSNGEYVFKTQIFEIIDILKECSYDNFVYKALNSVFNPLQLVNAADEAAAKAAFNQMCETILTLVRILKSENAKHVAMAGPKPRRRTFKRSRRKTK